MNGIIGMNEFTLDSDLNKSQRESLLLVHSLARSLLLINDDILDISKSKQIRRRCFQIQLLIFRLITTFEAGRMTRASLVFTETHGFR